MGVELGRERQPPARSVTDVTAADLDADIELLVSDTPATSDPYALADGRLGIGDDPDLQAEQDSGS